MAANAVTLDLPAESATMSTAAQYLNASLDSNDNSIENVSFYYRPVSGTGAWTLIGYKANTTNAQTTFNTTWNSIGVIDNNNSEINATAHDIAEDHVSTDASIKVIIDNGDPTATWSSTSVTNGIVTKYSVPFIAGIDADATIGVTNCTAWLATGGTAQDMTATANACSEEYAVEDFGITANGVYSLKIMVTDANADSTNTSIKIIELALLGSGTGPSDYLNGEDDGVIEGDEGIGDTTILQEKNIIVRVWNKIIEFFKGIFK